MKKFLFFIVLVFLTTTVSGESWALVIYDESHTGAQLDALVTAGEATYSSGRSVLVNGNRLDFLSSGANDWDIMYRLPIADAGEIESDLYVSLTLDATDLSGVGDWDFHAGISDGNNILWIMYLSVDNNYSVDSVVNPDYTTTWREVGASGPGGYTYRNTMGNDSTQSFPIQLEFALGAGSVDYTFTRGTTVFTDSDVSVVFDQSNQIEVLLMGDHAYEEYGISTLDVFSTATPIPEPATMLLLGSGLIGLAGVRRNFKKV